MIQVRFRPGVDLGSPELLLPAELRGQIVGIKRLFTLADEELDRIGSGTAKLWYRIELKADTDPERFIEAMKRLDSVDVVERAPLPARPPDGP